VLVRVALGIDAERERLTLYLALAAAVAGAFVASPDQVARMPVKCAFRRATGLPCPGCGLTRSWSLTAHGDLAGAFARHPFGPPSLLVAWGAVMMGPRAVPMRRSSVPRPLLVVAGAWLGWALYRMARDGRSASWSPTRG
jgi:membrane associated rhomboid family serine protease